MNEFEVVPHATVQPIGQYMQEKIWGSMGVQGSVTWQFGGTGKE